MWHAITGADDAREYWFAIEEIEQALLAHVEQETARSDGEANPSISLGTAGIALFLAHLHAATGREDHAENALETLALSTTALEHRRLLPTLYAGWVGIGWVVAHLSRQIFEGDADLTVAIDEGIAEILDRTEQATGGDRPPFELIGGLAGYGTYLVERLPDTGAEELIVRIVDRLARDRDTTGAWFSEPEWLPAWQRELMPRGYYNAGVAHGIPGVIGFLSAAWREGVRDARIPDLVDTSIRWLLAQRDPQLHGSILPGHIPLDGSPRPTRTAWCYGDLGAAVVLLSAARAFDRAEWEVEALDIARTAARRSAEETQTIDVGLCHGAAGIAHLFNRIHQATGDAGMRDAARTWFGRTLRMRRPGEGVAGILSWVQPAPGEGQWRAEPGFLGGAAGVALALLGAASDAPPDWDRVMLMAVPPRNGELAS